MGFALLRSKIESVAALLEDGDDVNRPLERIGFFAWEIETQNICSWLPVHLTCTHGYFKNGPNVLELLIENGADIHGKSPLGYEPIHLTAIYGWLNLTEVLLRYNASVDTRTQAMHDKVWIKSTPKGAMRSFEMAP